MVTVPAEVLTEVTAVMPEKNPLWPRILIGSAAGTGPPVELLPLVIGTGN